MVSVDTPKQPDAARMTVRINSSVIFILREYMLLEQKQVSERPNMY